MDANDLQGLITLVAMLAFGGVCWWAYSAHNRSRFEEDAMLPFADDGDRIVNDAGERDR
jgi:cytochrome c oxidase cbb3-type subunit 4